MYSAGIDVVGLEFEDEMAVGPLHVEERPPRPRDRLLELLRRDDRYG